jgi:hypothetical protein
MLIRVDSGLTRRPATWGGRALFAAMLALAPLSSCIAPISEAALLHAKDSIPPRVTIVSPSDGSSYAAMVVVTGTVADDATASGDAGKVSALSYRVTPDTVSSAAVPVAEDGAFSFRFPTTGVSGPVVVQITATDWNGNTAEPRLTLVDQGAIPSFSAEAGNHEVTLSWDAVPLAQSYTLYYTTNGSLPSQEYGTVADNVTSPCVLSGLRNGYKHVFLLRAHSSEGDDNWSLHQSAIPLSSLTLAPAVIPLYHRIMVEWSSIPASSEFEVLRSEERRGTYTNISGLVVGTSFTDTLVEMGTTYYYKVRLAMPGSLESAANAGEPGVFPTAEEVRVGSVYLETQPLEIAVAGTLALMADGYGWLRVMDVSHPASPALMGSCETPSYPTGVATLGSYALVAVGEAGVVVVDLADPREPRIVATFETPNSAYGIWVSGTTAFVADYLTVQVIDVSDPTSPSIVGSMEIAGGAVRITGSGTRMYVGGTKLTVVDVSNPSMPVAIGSCDLTGGWTGCMSVSGNRVFIADSTLEIVDVSNGAAPVVVGQYVSSTGSVTAVCARGSQVVVTDNSALVVLDVSTPSAPTVRESFPPFLGLVSSGPLAALGEYTLWASGGLAVYDLTSPACLTKVGSCGSGLG